MAPRGATRTLNEEQSWTEHRHAHHRLIRDHHAVTPHRPAWLVGHHGNHVYLIDHLAFRYPTANPHVDVALLLAIIHLGATHLLHHPLRLIGHVTAARARVKNRHWNHDAARHVAL